ncbi:MAG: hypothetical protein MPJ50_12945 [Pirellulales bacterium]|nr:hypothetical protein [Pirellulales bacterium]
MSSCLFLAVSFVISGELLAQRSQPFFVFGGGVAPNGLPLPGQGAGDHWAVGWASSVGLHFGSGAVQTDSANPQPNGTITGEFGSAEPFVFRGLSGSLATHYGRTAFGASSPGTFTAEVLDVLPDGTLIVTVEFVAEFVVQPNLSTGRFRGATGKWTMIANTEPFALGTTEPLKYSWYGYGSISTR